MGLLDIIGGIGKGLLGLGTGGASVLPSILGDVGSALTGAESGAAKGRVTEAGINQNQYKALLDGVTADLQRREYLSNQGQTDQKNAVRGGLLQGLQDISITPPAGIPMATITGGARPSAVTGASDIGKEISANAAPYLANPNLRAAGMPALPAAPVVPQAGGLDKFLSIAGAGTSLAGGIGQLIQNEQKKQQQDAASAQPSTRYSDAVQSVYDNQPTPISATSDLRPSRYLFNFQQPTSAYGAG